MLVKIYCNWVRDNKNGCWITNCGHSPCYPDRPIIIDMKCYCNKTINLFGQRKTQSLLTFNK